MAKFSSLKVNTNGDPFSRFFWHENTLVIVKKLKKTAWKVLKDKRNVKAPKRKLNEKLKICLKVHIILLQSFKCDEISLTSGE